MYLAAVWSKLQGPSWRDGSAVSYATRLPDLVRFRHAGVPRASPLFAHARDVRHPARRGQPRRARLAPPHPRSGALAAGVLLHLSIDASIRVGFFTLAVFTAYLSFADPARVRAIAAALRALGNASWERPLVQHHPGQADPVTRSKPRQLARHAAGLLPAGAQTQQPSRRSRPPHSFDPDLADHVGREHADVEHGAGRQPSTLEAVVRLSAATGSGERASHARERTGAPLPAGGRHRISTRPPAGMPVTVSSVILRARASP